MKTSTLDPDMTHETDSTADLIAALGNRDILVRTSACNELIARGDTVVADLMTALQSPNGNVRREAAVALRALSAPQAATALVQTLSDERFDVRWIAAEALIGLGTIGLRPLLQALTTAPWDAIRLRESTHHILRVLASYHQLYPILSPVVAALEGLEPGLTVPLAAHRAVEALEGI